MFIYLWFCMFYPAVTRPTSVCLNNSRTYFEKPFAKPLDGARPTARCAVGCGFAKGFTTGVVQIIDNKT